MTGNDRCLASSWVVIEAGEYRIGAQRKRADDELFDPDATARDHPPRTVSMRRFEIADFPVTVREFEHFVRGDGYRSAEFWREGGFAMSPLPLEWEAQLDTPDLPVVGVDWFTASACAAFFGAELPGEIEWECAARGQGGRRFPWGDDEPNSALLNALESGIGGPSPRDRFRKGATPEGVQDLAGNVWEWCATGWADGLSEDLWPCGEGKIGREPTFPRVMRGGCFAAKAVWCRPAFRSSARPDSAHNRRGFRLARR